MDPFGLYTADIEAGLNDAFVEKAGSGDDAPDDGTPRVAVPATRPVSSTLDGRWLTATAVPQPDADGIPAGVNGLTPEAAEELPASDVAAAAAAQAQGADPAEVEAALGGALEHALPPISTRPAFDAGAAGGPAPAASLAPSALDGEAHDAAIDAILQKDAFLVFRALCKLSIRTADVSSGTDLTAIRGKVCANPSLSSICRGLDVAVRQGGRWIIFQSFGAHHLVDHQDACRTGPPKVGIVHSVLTFNPDCVVVAGSGPGAAEDPAGEQRPCVRDIREVCGRHQAVPVPEPSQELRKCHPARAAAELLHLPDAHLEVPAEPEGGDRRLLSDDPAALHRAAARRRFPAAAQCALPLDMVG